MTRRGLERYNTRANRLENAAVERRDWNDCLPTRGGAQKNYNYDIVMGSDLLYDVSWSIFFHNIVPIFMFMLFPPRGAGWGQTFRLPPFH